MENIPTYIKRLLDIKENIQKKTITKENKIPIHTSFEDNLNVLICKYGLNNNFRSKDDKVIIAYSEHIENFISTLIFCIHFANSYKNKNTIPTLSPEKNYTHVILKRLYNRINTV